MSSSIKIDFVGWQVQVRFWREDLVWYWAHRYLKCHWLLITSAPSLPYTSLDMETALCSCDFPSAPPMVIYVEYITESNWCFYTNFSRHKVQYSYVCPMSIADKQNLKLKKKKTIVIKLSDKIKCFGIH